MARFIKAEAVGHSVIYTDDNGKYFRFSGGTWAWRNHNPGNVHPGDVSRMNHQIGVAGKSKYRKSLKLIEIDTVFTILTCLE